MKYNIIKTDNYLLVVDESEIKEGEYCINLQDKGNNIFPFMDMRNIGIGYNKKVIKKIIAHLPLNNSPILEGVSLLPPLPSGEDDVEKMAFRHTNPLTDFLSEKEFNCMKEGFISGYNKAKEKYRYTEEQLLSSISYALHVWEWRSGPIKISDIKEEIIQSLSQPKMPTHFEFETKTVWARNTDRNVPTKDDLDSGPKTTTNSQGQTQLVGNYVY